MSLIHILNRRGPRVEPRGTPENSEKNEENVPNIQKEEFMEDK
jgi:hypothetical protein